VQLIGVTPLDNQQKYKLPYLDFVLGLPCLTENKMPAPLHRYPQTTQQVKMICKSISSHTFSYCWRTAEGTLLAQSTPVTLHHVEQFFPELALEPFNDFFLSILVDQLQQTSDESQTSAAPATLSLSSSTSNPRNSLTPSTHTNLSSPEPFADINQPQNTQP
jgi:hypothetical protein